MPLRSVITIFLVPKRSLYWCSQHPLPLWLVLCQVVVWTKLLASWMPWIFVMPLKLMLGMIVADAKFILASFFSHKKAFIGREALTAAESINLCVLTKGENVDPQGSAQIAMCSSQLQSSSDITEPEVMEGECRTMDVKGREVCCTEIADMPNVFPIIDVMCGSQLQYFSDINEPEMMEGDCRTMDVKGREVCSTDIADMPNVFPMVDVSNSSDEIEAPFQTSRPKLKVSLTEPEAQQKKEEEVDEFYGEYFRKMMMLDLLNSERVRVLSAILRKQVWDSNVVERFAVVTSASDTRVRKLLRSLQNEFERVYVGQSCLCWDALHHQYLKIHQMTFSECHLSFPYDRTAQKFQKFKVLLERFMEEEGSRVERFWRYSKSRLASQNLLQVPSLSGHAEEKPIEGGDVEASKLLQTMQESVWSFWVFLSTDNKKTPWSVKAKLPWTDRLVEDPNDLELLFHLRKTLKEKKTRAKDLQIKKKGSLLKRIDTFEEAQKLEYLFALIEVTLVSRVMKMSHLSSSQLKWCKHKLESIEFHGGKVRRSSSGFLFPFS